MKLRILVAEDDSHTRSALAEVLRGEGHDVLEAACGLQAETLFDRQQPDLVCLDVMMPGRSGYDVCRHIRHRAPQTPILFVTAKAEEIDKVVGLELGGDDYIVKPFGAKEVLARIRAVARRCLAQADCENGGPADAPDRFRMGDLEICAREFRARRGPDAIALTRRELRILSLLFRRAGEVIERAELFRHAWEDDHIPNSRTLDQTISQLRKRIERDPRRPEIIRTVYGVGYRYEPDDSSSRPASNRGDPPLASDDS